MNRVTITLKTRANIQPQFPYQRRRKISSNNQSSFGILKLPNIEDVLDS